MTINQLLDQCLTFNDICDMNIEIKQLEELKLKGNGLQKVENYKQITSKIIQKLKI